MINPRAILAITRKDALDVLLNKTTLSVLITPVFLAVLFLIISRLIGDSSVTKLLIYNPGQSKVQQAISAAFNSVQITNANSPADVTAAFGTNGTHRDAIYDVGLIVPAQFEQEIQAGGHPQLSLYLNGSSVSTVQGTMLQTAIANYARSVSEPQSPLKLVTTTINPTPLLNANIGEFVGAVYKGASLMLASLVGLTLLPGMLIEEKEKKTLRMLMVTAVSFREIIWSKLLTALLYQLVLSLLVLTIQGGWSGNVPLLLLYILLSACFSLALGLLVSSIIHTSGAAGVVCAVGTFLYIVPAIFVSPVGQLLGKGNPFLQVLRILPTYYLSDGIFNALQNQGAFGDYLLDATIILGSSIVMLLCALRLWHHYITIFTKVQ